MRDPTMGYDPTAAVMQQHQMAQQQAAAQAQQVRQLQAQAAQAAQVRQLLAQVQQMQAQGQAQGQGQPQFQAQPQPQAQGFLVTPPNLDQMQPPPQGFLQTPPNIDQMQPPPQGFLQPPSPPGMGIAEAARMFPGGPGAALPAPQPSQAMPAAPLPQAQPQTFPQPPAQQQQPQQGGLLGGVMQTLGLAVPNQGIGLFGSPAQAAPEDLSDLSPLQNLVLRFRNAEHMGADRGGMMPSQQMRDERRLGNDRRLAAFNQALGYMQQFDSMLAQQRPEDIPGSYAIVRRQFAQLGGGDPENAGQFIDAFLGGRPGRAQALLQIAKEDPEIGQMVRMGSDVRSIAARAEEKSREGTIFSDSLKWPALYDKIAAVMRGEGLTPEQYGLIQTNGVLPTGGFSLPRVLNLLPPGMFDLNDREILMRHIDELSDQGFTADEEFDKYQALQMEAHLGRGVGGGGRGGGRPRRATQGMYDSGKFGARIFDGNQRIEKLMAKARRNWDPTTKWTNTQLGFLVPNFFRDEEQKEYDAAAESIVSGVLRDDSGATIKTDEGFKEAQRLIPQFTDGAQLVKDKRKARLLEIERARAAAGDAWGVPSNAPEEYDQDYLNSLLGPIDDDIGGGGIAGGGGGGRGGGGYATDPRSNAPPPFGYGGRFDLGPTYGGSAAEAMAAGQERAELEEYRRMAAEQPAPQAPPAESELDDGSGGGVSGGMYGLMPGSYGKAQAVHPGPLPGEIPGPTGWGPPPPGYSSSSPFLMPHLVPDSEFRLGSGGNQPGFPGERERQLEIQVEGEGAPEPEPSRAPERRRPAVPSKRKPLRWDHKTRQWVPNRQSTQER